MAHRDIVVVGASVGGVEALQRLVRDLPVHFPASVFIVLHLAAESLSLLAPILERAGHLPAVQPRDGDRIRSSQVYVAPPDYHLLLEHGVVRLSRGPRENRHRPAIDPLFRSAARAYGQRVIGVVLTGALDDGTAGLLAIHRQRGLTIVQDPKDAFCPDMPKNALRHVKIDHVLPLDQISHKLTQLVREPLRVEPQPVASPSLDREVKMAEFDMKEIEQEANPGKPSTYACPECNGVLWEHQDGDLLRFRCRVGHAYTAYSLAADQQENLEGALWAALRALEESASLASRMAQRARDRRQGNIEQRYADVAESKQEHSRLLRRVLLEAQQQPASADQEAS